MKTLTKCVLLAGLAMGGLLMSGCTGTLAYTGEERWGQISRNMATELGYTSDDIDYVLMLRPLSTATVWNVYHR